MGPNSEDSREPSTPESSAGSSSDNDVSTQPETSNGRRLAHMSLRVARRIAVGVIGATVVAIGLVMLLTPGPAIVVIPVGLSILALEFAWARRLLARFHEQASRARNTWFTRGR